MREHLLSHLFSIGVNMLETYKETKQEFIDKFYEWYLKAVPLDVATKATDYLIEHVGKAQEISCGKIKIMDDDNVSLKPVLVITVVYHIEIEGTLNKRSYECVIDLPKES